jgi:Protein of unknown function (DUF2785)
MDTSFWQSIVDADFALPHDCSAADLTPELISFLSSTDPRLRDDFGFSILATWLDRGGYYSPDQLRQLGAHMARNLSIGLGETETDTVFGRAFSTLILGKVVDADNRQPFLSADEVYAWLDQALAYVRSERDVRGFVPDKGWAHAVAHMGDLLMVLARNRHVGVRHLEQIVENIGGRMAEPVPHMYRALEDERMAYAVMVALQRELLTPEFLSAWLDRLAQRWSGSQWLTLVLEAETTNAYQNTRQFLRSLYFQLLLGIRAPSWYSDPTPFEHSPSVRETLLDRLVAGLRIMDRRFYAAAPQPSQTS